jgi:uroporphyrinogen-III synthase
VPDTGATDLTGIRVLVTRPVAQARELALQIERAGGQAIVLPSIEIAGPADELALERIIARLDTFDLAVFISRNSVQQALDRIEQQRGAFPPSVRIAAVGAGTAAALRARGCEVTIAPQTNYRSETLLQSEELQQVDGLHVVIFRGRGGRELLADTLRARGATVDYAECYQRLRPETDTAEIVQHWQTGGIDIVISTSVEGLENLDAMLGETGRRLLRETPMVIIGPRMAAACRRMGVKQALMASEASDAALLAAVDAWRQDQKAV